MAIFRVGNQFINETGVILYRSGNVFVNETLSILTEPDASSDVLFSDSVLSGLETDNASNDLLFTDAAICEHPLELDAESIILFTQSSDSTNPQPFEKEAESTVLFSDIAVCSLKVLTASNSLLFNHTAIKERVVDGLEKSSLDSLLFSQTVLKVKINFDAIAEDADSDLLFTPKATLPYFRRGQNTLLFTNSAAQDRVKTLENEIIFDYALSVEGTWTRPGVNTLLFAHAFTYELTPEDRCNYTPFIGANTDPNAPVPPPKTSPVLIRQSFVRLYYPIVSPTITVTIRAPEFGDRDRLQHDRINRETRGGTLRVFADPTWPKQQVLSMQFVGLRESEAQAVISFFEETLGLDIGFLDWEGRHWTGVILTPDAEIIRNRQTTVDLSFEFEGALL